MPDRPLLHRIHNPRNRECGCVPECWCKRTAIGRLVRWWFPARWFGISHKTAFFDGMTTDEIRAWKQEQERKGMTPMVVQPRYESIRKLGPMRYGMTVRHADGGIAVHELGRLFVKPS